MLHSERAARVQRERRERLERAAGARVDHLGRQGEEVGVQARGRRRLVAHEAEGVLEHAEAQRLQRAVGRAAERRALERAARELLQPRQRR